MKEVVDLICFKCKHKKLFQIGCNAFPEGIPYVIQETNDHSKPLPEQKNDLVFEMDPKKEGPQSLI